MDSVDINLEMKRYAAAFTYFLLKRLERVWFEKISSVILFGSVAQERAVKGSDIDIFVDANISQSGIRQLRSAAQKAKEEFLLSNEALLYKAKGIYSDINVIVGNLSGWEEMKKSVSLSGIVFYGSYKGDFGKDTLESCILFFWEEAGRNRGAFLNKIYGYTTRRKKYAGTIQRFSGAKTGKSAAIIPSVKAKDFMKILEKYKVKYRTIEVFL